MYLVVHFVFSSFHVYADFISMLLSQLEVTDYNKKEIEDESIYNSLVQYSP